jgi:acetoin utilization deacetylase AcuC-like enzyme
MTEMVMEAADTLCDGRLMMAHEGGYSEVHVPFLAHSVLEAMARSDIHAEDPFQYKFEGQQPAERFNRYVSQLIAEMEDALGY